MSLSVLIVDDSATTRAFIEQAVKLADPEVQSCYHAADGRQALEELGRTWIDLIFADLHMPGMDGREFLRRVRAVDLWKDIPVAIITSERSDATEIELVELGANYYQKKPLTPEAVREILGSLREMMP